MIFGVENIVAVALGLCAAFFPGALLRKSVSNAVVLVVVAAIYVAEFLILRTGATNRSVDALATDIFAATGVTLIGPIYIGVIGTVLAKWLRSGVAARTVFCAIAVAAAIVLAFGYWYGTRQ